LTETSLSIHEISERVGYLYSNAFIRFFKNQIGMTPGQYKNIHMSNS
ncbi:MAG: helix-turn-helix domain-containing protein, partial [Bacilli bacterium]|nr:helix-turn-helix domain-containing protein [Bacilli bacterium]